MTVALHLSDRRSLPSGGTPAGRSGAGNAAFGWLVAAAAVALVGWLTRAGPGWLTMWALAATEFWALKLATLGGLWTRVPPARIAAYLVAWPGTNARAFLHGAASRPGAGPARYDELAFAVAKFALGLLLAGWATRHAAAAPPLVVGWVGMLGIIFALHFGVLHVVSWGWRRAGWDAPPLMRAPIAATSLAGFWGERWNIAFAEGARRFVMRPLARRVGARGAGLAVFVISGLVHETVISLPARGGWGGPTLYFLLHALGIEIEKSAMGIRLGLGRGFRGWLWTLFVAVAPLPLLFHEPFVRNVIVPLYRSLAACLP